MIDTQFVRPIAIEHRRMGFAGDYWHAGSNPALIAKSQ